LKNVRISMTRKIHKSHKMTRYKLSFGDNSNMFLKPVPSMVRYCKVCHHGQQKFEDQLGRGFSKERLVTHRQIIKPCKGKAKKVITESLIKIIGEL